MNLQRFQLVVCLAAAPLMAATMPDIPGVPTQMVVTVLPAKGAAAPANLQPNDLTVLQGNARLPVLRMERLNGDLADMQLFILMDDSTRTASLGTHIKELKQFIGTLPASTQVAIGYMRNGSFQLTQGFTADHAKAAASVRLPIAMPGVNGSPYFSLEDLIKHWPSKQATDRRAVLMMTDGVDRYWNTIEMDDPYEDAAIRSALQNGVEVYSIYLRGAGLYGRREWVTNFAQSRLIQVSEETGGNAYFEAFTDPVDIAPFLHNLQDRLDNQYRVTVSATGKGMEEIKLRTELPGVKVEGPTRMWVK